MTDVTRYELRKVGSPYNISSKEMCFEPEGDWVNYDDHLREVTRLQRARARNLVKRLRLSGAIACECLGHLRTEETFEKWADRIAAKYLNEVGNG